ncbi:MAG: tetratricopeptide repeat protein [Nitrososphaerota archaeon]
MLCKTGLVVLAITCLLISSIHGTAATSKTDKMFTYHNPYYGTKVQYPSDWKFSIDEGEPTFFPAGSDLSDGYSASVWFSKRNLNESTGIGYYLDYSRKYYDNFPDIEVVRAVSNATLDEYPAYVLEWVTTDEYGRKYNTMKIGTIIGTEEYYITYYATEETYKLYLPTVHNMLKTFEIELPETNKPYITFSPKTIWSDDKLDVYVVVDENSKEISSKYVQDAMDAINTWSNALKEYSNNSEAWNFNVKVVTEKLSKYERFQAENPFRPPANIIIELKESTEDEQCAKLLGESIHPPDIDRFSVYSYAFTSCNGVEFPHEIVYSTVLHEFAHDLGLGHTYYRDGDLMCSSEEDKHEHQVVTCADSEELKKFPSELNVQGLIYRYGVDGFDTPNKKLKGEEPRYYQKLAVGTLIDNKTKIDRLLTQGWTATDFNRTEEALTFYDRALAIDPKDSDALFAKGWALDSLGKYDEAILYYDKVLSIDPTDTDALYEKGYTLKNLGKYDEAILYYDKVLSIDPNDTYGLYGKGLVLETLGKYDEAILYYDKVLSIDPTDSDALEKRNDLVNNVGIQEE